MALGVLIDAGPLIAYFCRRESHHGWAVETLDAFEPPLITCEPVLVETCFVIARDRLPPARVLEPVEQGRIHIGFQVHEDVAALRSLMERYADVPMSLADACLVRMADMTGLPICTMDADFAIYRTHRRRPLTLITPGPARYVREA